MARWASHRVAALAVPIVVISVMWLLILGLPGVHNVMSKRGVDCRDFSRAELRRSILSLWQVLNEAGILDQPGVMADWGTLLGAVREGDLIEHDYDIDIRAPAGQICALYWRLVPIVATQPHLKLRATHIVLACGAYPTIWIGDTRYGTGVDIEPYIVERGRVHRASYFTVLRRAESALIARQHRSVPEGDVFPLRTVNVRGRPVNVPLRAETILEHYYGPDWRVPVIKKRVANE